MMTEESVMEKKDECFKCLICLIYLLSQFL